MALKLLTSALRALEETREIINVWSGFGCPACSWLDNAVAQLKAIDAGRATLRRILFGFRYPTPVHPDWQLCEFSVDLVEHLKIRWNLCRPQTDVAGLRHLSLCPNHGCSDIHVIAAKFATEDPAKHLSLTYLRAALHQRFEVCRSTACFVILGTIATILTRETSVKIVGVGAHEKEDWTPAKALHHLDQLSTMLEGELKEGEKPLPGSRWHLLVGRLKASVRTPDGSNEKVRDSPALKQLMQSPACSACGEL